MSKTLYLPVERLDTIANPLDSEARLTRADAYNFVRLAIALGFKQSFNGYSLVLFDDEERERTKIFIETSNYRDLIWKQWAYGHNCTSS